MSGRFMAVILVVATSPVALLVAEPPRTGPRYPGGATTVIIPADADEVILKGLFGNRAANLPESKRADFDFGRRLFIQGWMWAPGFARDVDGVGPIFTQHSCIACHDLDGRGRPPRRDDEAMSSLILHLSVPGADEHGGPKPHPTYGRELSTRAIRNLKPEGRATVRYREIEGRFDDGETYRLRVPTYRFDELNFGPLGDDAMFSPRVAPVMSGLGLLEAVSEADIASRADEHDRDGDGISGRVNKVWDHAANKHTLGRFGWKAGQPTLRQQIASAFLRDMGLTTSMFPRENITEAQKEAALLPTGGTPEVSDQFMDKLTFYAHTLALPERRQPDDPQVKRGETLFASIGCAKCHTPSLTTGKHEVAEISNQIIFPYTDLLLHDMGDDLADHRPEYEASGKEWRTPPLWGCGLIEKVNGHTFYLHDGRARNLEEAVLWHGGEGAASRDAYRKLPKDDRTALLKFVGSL